jgi:PAS domain S-box-containing protein
MTSVVILVTGSVALISIVLSIYFSQRLESEFKKKILAQKGQAETILKTRLADIEQSVTTLSTDNSLRVTMMMDDTTQVEERAREFYSEIQGVSFYIKKQGQERIYPQVHPDLSDQILKTAKSKPIRGEIVEAKGMTRLLWWFEAPIMHKEKQMGDAFALYDMMQDKELADTIRQTIQANILISKADELIGLIRDATIPLNETSLNTSSKDSGFIQLDPDWVLIPLDGFQNLYFSSSRKDLSMEKRNVALFIGIFTLSVLTFSVLFSILLGKRLTRPLSEMANKAYHISRGVENISFKITNGDYTEFQRLSRVFNDMLAKLKDMEEKARYTELMENVDDAVYIVDSQGKIIQANEATRRQLGYHADIPLDLEHDAILPEKDTSIIRGLLNNDQDQKPSKMTIETFHIGRDGNPVPVEINVRAITYRGQKVILNVARDIRTRKEAERALRESEERYRSVVESSHDGIVIIDRQRLIVYVNTQLCRILGYPRNEIEGKKFIDFFPDTIASFATGQNSENTSSVPENFSFTRKNGQKRHGSIRVTTIIDPGGNHKTVIQLLDITDQLRVEQEKKQLEAQLLHAQKMEAIGTLAGGVAHDFNNLLQVIHGYTELLMAMKEENDPELQQLQEIKNASQRASELTDQLLTFSRKTDSSAMPVNLSNEVEQSCRLLDRTLPSTIETKLYLADDLMMINADPGRIQQVVMNLGVNARDAMPEGGRLVIETKNVFLDATRSKKYLEATPGDYICLSVTDNGHGMDEETIKHIFEPFFSTKTAGKGTGLGMAIVYGIVQDTGGYITCYSEVGIGTTFRIYFPAAKQKEGAIPSLEDNSNTKNPQAASRDKVSVVDDPKLKGSETILLVDDEERIRNLGIALLSQCGYTVLTAANGIEALTVYQAKRKDIDLVILDLVMPEMDGRKCFQKLKSMNPEINVIMSSGYSVVGSSEDFESEGAKAFIDKPYEFHEMLQTIRNILDE